MNTDQIIELCQSNGLGISITSGFHRGRKMFKGTYAILKDIPNTIGLDFNDYAVSGDSLIYAFERAKERGWIK